MTSRASSVFGTPRWNRTSTTTNSISIFYRKFSAEEGSFEARFAAAFADAFEHITPIIDDGELIVGQASYTMTDAEADEWARLRKDVALQYATFDGQDSHMAVDYELLLREGTSGIRNRIDALLKSCRADQRAFYDACISCLKGMEVYARHYSELARAMAEQCEDPVRKEELSELAEICAHVPQNPARTFHEAVQSVHFLTLCLSFAPLRPGAMQQFQLGHPDRYLWPYYQADLEAGRITPERAQVLFDCLAIQINRRVPHGLSSGYMVGGRDRNGEIVANALTKMGMQAVDDVHLVYSSVGLCRAESMPEEMLELACEILSHGRSHPAIFNDDVIVSGLKGYGARRRTRANTSTAPAWKSRPWARPTSGWRARTPTC